MVAFWVLGQVGHSVPERLLHSHEALSPGHGNDIHLLLAEMPGLAGVRNLFLDVCAFKDDSRLVKPPICLCKK